MSGISSHILDVANGCPAAGITVQLYRHGALLSTQETNEDGRILALLPPDKPLTAGTYRIRFDIAPYFPKSFFPEVIVVFEVTDVARNYHVPLLLSPFGYSIYRGS